ncbi:MAG: FtsX-like permease family protein [Oscillibacter sp.]|nr:FtsX-like permease family protein [Oscillibacter sp.]
MKGERFLAVKELLAQRVTSVLILLAILLSTMMTAVIGQSIGVLSAMRQQQAIAINGNRHAWFIQMNSEQLETLKGDGRLSFVGSSVVLGSARLDNTLILGLSEFQEDVSAVYPSLSAVKEGRLPEAPMEIALPEDVLGYLGVPGRLGDPLTLSLTKALRHGIVTQSYDFTAEFTLVGVTESNYMSYAAGSINGLVGPGTAEALLPEEYLYYNVDVRVKDKGAFQATMDDLVETLNVHELDIVYNVPYLDALGIRYSGEVAGVTDASGEGFSLMLAAGILVGALLLLAAGLVIYNILKIAVSRRTTQYGVLRAIGAEKGQLYTLVTAQVLLLCAIGIPLGLLLGTLSARGILAAATGLLSPEIFLVRDAGELNRLIAENSDGKGLFLLASAAVTLFFALTAALPAARYAAKVSPTAAMAGNRVRIKRRDRRAKKIRSFEAYYARLNLKRSRGRTAITVLSLVMSITVFIALQGAVGLLDIAGGGITEHNGDYSITNETVGFSPGEYQAMGEDSRVKELSAMQFSLYEQGTDGIPVGIAFGFPLQPTETFQVVGLNGAYWDRAFSSLAPEVLEKLKAGEGCMVRNPIPLVFEGEEIPRTTIPAGDRITVAGRELTVLETLDGYETYLSVGNSGFVNGVQIIVNEELYAALTGKTAYNWLLPVLAEGVDRADFDAAVEALAARTPGTLWLSYEETDRQLAESFAQIQLLAWGLILFVALIGLLNIINTVYTNIHTRVTEIGTQRAIGMSAGSLFKVFLWEGAYYGMIAAAIGSVAGYACTIFVEAAATNEIRLVAVPVLPIVEAAALAIAACLLATCVPLRRISKMSMVESIEAVE